MDQLGDFNATVQAKAKEIMCTIVENGTFGENYSIANGSKADCAAPQEESGQTAVTLITVVVYSFICVAGLIGNGLVIFVITRYTKMKTVTNMYILNLSIVDTLFLLGLPMAITTPIIRNWVFGSFMCKVYYISLCVNIFTGAFTLVVMSFDRFLAVVYPMQSVRYRTGKYALIAIATIWTISFIVMIPIFLYTYSKTDGRQSSCSIYWPESGLISPSKAFVFYSLLVGFVIPILLISVLYSLLILRLRKVGMNIKSLQKKRSRRKVTQLVTMIIIVYIVCWLPYWGFQIHLISSCPTCIQDWEIKVYQFLIILSFTNSMVNPFLYAFTNENFRQSFISAFKCAQDPILLRGSRRGSDMASTIGSPQFRNPFKKAEAELAQNEYECANLNGATPATTIAEPKNEAA